MLNGTVQLAGFSFIEQSDIAVCRSIGFGARCPDPQAFAVWVGEQRETLQRMAN